MTWPEWNAVSAMATIRRRDRRSRRYHRRMAKHAAHETVNETALVSALLRDYRAPEMAAALQRLHDWAQRCGPLPDVCESVWNAGNPKAKELDDARRRGGGYFGTAWRLYEHGPISQHTLKVVAGVAGLHAGRDYLLALEPKVNLGERNADHARSSSRTVRVARSSSGRQGGNSAMTSVPAALLRHVARHAQPLVGQESAIGNVVGELGALVDLHSQRWDVRRRNTREGLLVAE